MNAPWESGGGMGFDGTGPLYPYGKWNDQHKREPTRIPGYEIHYGAYHTLTKGVFLPAGSLLPGGANFAQQAVIDFPLHFPVGTTCPGGIMVPVVMRKKDEKKDEPKKEQSFMEYAFGADCTIM